MWTRECAPRTLHIEQNDTCHDFGSALSISEGNNGGGGRIGHTFVYMFARHRCDVIILNDTDQNRAWRPRYKKWMVSMPSCYASIGRMSPSTVGVGVYFKVWQRRIVAVNIFLLSNRLKMCGAVIRYRKLLICASRLSRQTSCIFVYWLFESFGIETTNKCSKIDSIVDCTWFSISPCIHDAAHTNDVGRYIYVYSVHSFVFICVSVVSCNIYTTTANTTDIQFSYAALISVYGKMYQNTVIYIRVHIISGTDSHAFESSSHSPIATWWTKNHI